MAKKEAKITKKEVTRKRNATRKKRKKLSEKQRILRRSIFYAVCLFVVYQLMLIPLQSRMYEIFWIVAGLGFCVVVSELLYSRLTELLQPIRFDMGHIRSVRWREHLLHHAVIPGLLYLSGVLFLFFNRVRVLDQAAIVLLSGAFFVIFYNMSATYLKMYGISRDTRLIFDFVNILVFYFFIDVLINLVFYEGFSNYVVFAGAALITFVLIGMMVSMMRQFSWEILFMLVLTSVLMGLVVFAVWQSPIFNIAVLSLVATVMFYMFDVYWHHSLEGSFTWDVMAQYGLFATMAIILLLYL